MAIPAWSTLTGDEKRARTLAAADDLFAREGLDVAMPVLAAAIGAGVGSIYRQVGAKEDVIAALVIERALALVRRFEAALEEPDALAALVQRARPHLRADASHEDLRIVFKCTRQMDVAAAQRLTELVLRGM